MKTNKPNNLAIIVQDFFLNYLIQLKGVSQNTVLSYRDCLKQLLLFLAKNKTSVCDLTIEDMQVSRIIDFLNQLETDRGNSSSTRNVRFAAIRAFFHYLATISPEHIYQAQQILNIPFKLPSSIRMVQYIETEELCAIIDAIDLSKHNGLRDHTLLAFMFNTGTRVQEVINLKANDLQLSNPFRVRIFGKGNKERICPIWASTAQLLRKYLEKRQVDLKSSTTVFINYLQTPLTRQGIRHILTKYVRKASHAQPSLKHKRIHPHSMRHSMAVHLIKSGVDIVTIAQLLGHSNINTTNKYTTIDLDMKRKAIEQANPPKTKSKPKKSWRNDNNLLNWLESF